MTNTQLLSSEITISVCFAKVAHKMEKDTIHLRS